MSDTTATVDTQGTPPAPASTPAPATGMAACVEEARARIASASNGDEAETETATTSATTKGEDEEPAGKDTGEPAAEQEQVSKYKTLAEAEKANKEASRKITELSQELARLKADTKPAGTGAGDQHDDAGSEDAQADDQSGTTPGNAGGDLLTDDMILTSEEEDALWAEDPDAARQYRDAYVKTMVARERDPIANELQQARADAQRANDEAAVFQLATRVDKEHGEGSYQRIEKQLQDEKYMAKLMADEVIKETLQPLLKSNPLAAMKFLVREVIAFDARVAAQKRARSHPAGTGAGVPTESPDPAVKSMSDAVALARRRLGRT